MSIETLEPSNKLPNKMPPTRWGGESIGARQQFDFSRIIEMVKLRKKYFYTFGLMLAIGWTTKFFLYIPAYTGQASASIQQPPRNPMVDTSYYNELAMSESINVELVKKYMKFLRSNAFFLNVAQTLKFKENYNQLILVPPREMSLFKKHFWTYFFSREKAENFRQINEIITPEPVLIPVERLAMILQDLTAFDTDGTSTITAHVTTLDPETSMVLANTMMEVFIQISSEKEVAEILELRRFVEKQLRATRDELKKAELELVDFKKKHANFIVDAEHKALAERITKLESDIENGKIQLSQNNKLLTYYKNTIQDFEKNVVQHGASAIGKSAADQVAYIRKKLDSLKSQKELALSQGITEKSWQLQQLNIAINATSKELAELQRLNKNIERSRSQVDIATAREKVIEFYKTNEALESQIETLKKAKAELAANLTDLPEQEQNLLNLTRKVSLEFELYSNLSKRLQELEIQKVSTNAKVSISEASERPPPNPRPSYFAGLIFAVLTGLFVATILTILLEATDNTIKTVADLEDLALTVVGEIPRLTHSIKNKEETRNQGGPELLICRNRYQSFESMAFKYLRTNIKQSLDEHKSHFGKVIVITSPNASEGKTLICANLAICNAQLEPSKRSILIDCNLRAPSLFKLLKYEEGNGLTSLLNLKALLEDIIVHDSLPNLDVIPAGWEDGNATEILSDIKFSLLIEYLKSEYDYVIIDAPPVLAAVDAPILTSMADFVLLVTRWRLTRKNDIFLAYKKILQVSQKRVHAVINGLEPKTEYREWLEKVTVLRKSAPLSIRHARRTEDKLAFEKNLEERKQKTNG